MSEYVKKYASEEALRQSEQSAAVSSSSESSMSEFSEDEAQVCYTHTRVQGVPPIGCRPGLS